LQIPETLLSGHYLKLCDNSKEFYFLLFTFASYIEAYSQASAIVMPAFSLPGMPDAEKKACEVLDGKGDQSFHTLIFRQEPIDGDLRIVRDEMCDTWLYIT
jgi:hypothetical protein